MIALKRFKQLLGMRCWPFADKHGPIGSGIYTVTAVGGGLADGAAGAGGAFPKPVVIDGVEVAHGGGLLVTTGHSLRFMHESPPCEMFSVDQGRQHHHIALKNLADNLAKVPSEGPVPLGYLLLPDEVESSEEQQSLKPCPFCGDREPYSMPVFNEWGVSCANGCCQTSGPYQEDAEEAWNTRAPDLHGILKRAKDLLKQHHRVQVEMGVWIMPAGEATGLPEPVEIDLTEAYCESDTCDATVVLIDDLEELLPEAE